MKAENSTIKGRMMVSKLLLMLFLWCGMIFISQALDVQAGTVTVNAVKPVETSQPKETDKMQPAKIVRELSDGIEFVSIPPGCFITNGERVCLDAFRIGKYEITQSQWKAVMGNNPSIFSNCGDDCPVEHVNWNMIDTFLRKLNIRTGKKYRLPTEAEWEYACRGGRNEQYCGGNSADDVAWYNYNSGKGIHRVGTRQPNGFGIHDMSGNVWEWVSDWYGEQYPSGNHNPTGPATGISKVLRGGSWDGDDRYAQTYYRFRSDPGIWYYYFGFRLVDAQD